MLEKFVSDCEKEFGKKSIGSFYNGNHMECLLEDGTRVKQTIDESFPYLTYDFPINFDIKINNRCDGGCPYCHENSTREGSVPNLSELIDTPFFNSLKAGTEMAIGGGNVFESPDLEQFLIALKKRGIIPNLTVNQKHLKKNFEKLKYFIDNKLVYGVGISMTSRNREDFKLLDRLGNNIVIHVINGILEKEDIPFLIGRKVLILGYKNLRKGHDLLFKENQKIRKNQEYLANNLKRLSKVFGLTSFDCLAINQLNPRQSLGISDSDWNTWFQGDDFDVRDKNGNITCCTFYLDLPNKKVGRSSTVPLDKRETFNYNETIEELFKKSIKGW